MMRVVLLTCLLAFVTAEAPLPYRYDPPQQQQHDQLSGFRPSHGYPCPDGIASHHHHHNHQSEGRIVTQHHHIETSGEPILAQQLPLVSQPEKQFTVNSQISIEKGPVPQTTFLIQQPNKGYIPPPPPAHHVHHQQGGFNNFHGQGGSIIHGIGKAQPPPFILNNQQQQHHHHHQHVVQHIPSPQVNIPFRQPQPQYLPPRPVFQPQPLPAPAPAPIQPHGPPAISVQHNNFHAEALTSGGASFGSSGSISGQYGVPEIHSGPSSVISTGPSFGSSSGGSSFGSSSGGSSFGSSVGSSFGSSSVGSSFGSSSGGSLTASYGVPEINSGSGNVITTGPAFGGNSFGSSSSGSFGGASFGSGSGNFQSIGSTHGTFRHPQLDDGLTQVISETFANAGVGENVEKHIYVHVPPEDLEERTHGHIQQPLPAAAPKKHYKIIFIKAPNQQPSTNVYTQLAQQQATEEKTLVYVLVKKPEEPTIQEIQQIQNTYKPSKPEVYFIKYKTRKEQEQAQGNGHIVGSQIDLTNGGQFEGSDLGGSGIDIRGSFNGENNHIEDALAPHAIIEPRIPIGNVPAEKYGPPSKK